MSGRHTPGPWTFEVNGDGYPIKGAIKGHPVRIATVHGMQSHDAKLIAAAPELLEALKLARNRVAFEAENYDDAAADLKRIDAVLDKAEGRL